MTLFEIKKQMLECIDPETGEIDVDRLNALEMARDEKIENIGCWIKNLTSDAEALSRESKNMKARADAAERKAESLKGYLTWALDGQKFSTPKVAISWRKSTKVNITDEESIPDDYASLVLTRKIDKAELKKALKAGEEIDGAELVEGNNIQIK